MTAAIAAFAVKIIETAKNIISKVFPHRPAETKNFKECQLLKDQDLVQDFNPLIFVHARDSANY